MQNPREAFSRTFVSSADFVNRLRWCYRALALIRPRLFREFEHMHDRRDFIRFGGMALLGGAFLSGTTQVFAQSRGGYFKIPSAVRLRAGFYTADTFKPLVKSYFSVKRDGVAESSVRLVEVAEKVTSGSKAARTVRSFNLIFEAGRGVDLADGIYTVSHPGIGDLDIFISHVGRGRQRYQAVFTAMDS